MKKTTLKRILTIALAVLMIGVFALTACEKDTPADSGAAPAASDSGDQATGPDITKGMTKVDIYNEDIKLLYVPIGDTGPAFVMGRYAIFDTLKFLKNVSVDIKPGEFDPTKQAEIVKDALTQDYDGIFLEAMDPVVSSGPIADAEAKGIPVITINLNSQTPHTMHVQGNDFISGQEAGKILGAAIDGKGNALTLNGPAAQQATNRMIDGFNDYVTKNYPDIKLLGDLPCEGWQADEANKQMADALTKNEKIDIVYAASDDLADGAIKAITAAGRQDEIKVYGAMGFPAALQRIKDGTQFGSYFSDGYSEYQTVIYSMLYFIQNGINATSMGYTDTPTIDQPTTPITKNGDIEGSIPVEQVIEESRWKLVMPDAFK